MTQGEAIREAMVKTIICFTVAASAQGQSGQEVWQALQDGIMEISGVSRSVASYIIRAAWENYSKEVA